MPDSLKSNNKLNLKIVTPEGQFCSLECETAVFRISDDEDGKGSGSYGVRKGHTLSVFSVQAGTISAYKDSAKIFSAEIGNGFALMEANVLTVTTENACEIV